MTNWIVAMDPYLGSYGAQSGVYEVKEETVEKAIIKILDKSAYGWDDDDDLQPTLENLKALIDRGNGDGCDYIILIVDLDEGKVLYKN